MGFRGCLGLRPGGVLCGAALLLAAAGCFSPGDGVSGRLDAGAPISDGQVQGLCGNGIIDPGEQCDGVVFAQSCEGLGLGAGLLGCDGRCQLDTSMCAIGVPPPPVDAGVIDPPLPLALREQACTRALECETIPLNESFGFVPAGQFPIVLTPPPCPDTISNACVTCQLTALATDELDPDDAGPGDSCVDASCLQQCHSLTRERAFGLRGTECETLAPRYLPEIDASCTCGCGDAVVACLTDESCFEALICIGRTGCQGTQCRTAGVCPAELRALDLFGTAGVPTPNGGLLDEALLCMRDQGCPEGP